MRSRKVIVAEFGFTLHLRTRGEEVQSLTQRAGFKARRWVVERSHSWMNRFRRVLIRWEKKAENYLGMLHLACAIITCRAAPMSMPANRMPYSLPDGSDREPRSRCPRSSLSMRGRPRRLAIPCEP